MYAQKPHKYGEKCKLPFGKGSYVAQLYDIPRHTRTPKARGTPGLPKPVVTIAPSARPGSLPVVALPPRASRVLLAQTMHSLLASVTVGPR